MGEPLRIGWTRGHGCSVLAEILAGGQVERLSGDLEQSCLSQRIDLVIARRAHSRFDLTNVASPFDFEPESTSSIAALVAGGPHSDLVVEIAVTLGERLGQCVRVLSGYLPDENEDDAKKLVAAYGERVDETSVIAAEQPGDLVDELPEDALLVVGAPGGSLLQRAFFGPGKRLRAQAPQGAIVAQAAPRRAFRMMEEPVFVSPHLSCGDGARLIDESIVAVVDAGKLVGMARRSSLRVAGQSVRVGDVMIQPRFVRLTAPDVEVMAAWEELEHAPVPVVDEQDFMHGSIRF